MAEVLVVVVLLLAGMYVYRRMMPRKSPWHGGLPGGAGQSPFISNADLSAGDAPVLGEDGTAVIGSVNGKPWTQGMESEYLAAVRQWGSSPFASVVPIGSREQWMLRGTMKAAPIDLNAVDEMF